MNTELFIIDRELINTEDFNKDLPNTTILLIKNDDGSISYTIPTTLDLSDLELEEVDNSRPAYVLN